ncbi:MAG: thioredoxin family protein [Candidatus Bathyarchaeota archaeon]|nr:glutaredoxin [Candidatus Bathyarchaeota archaeon A05DMB-3]MDH7606774.1 thioredoxin family protein [Candidatus Bathyarchaeota archaeon]
MIPEEHKKRLQEELVQKLHNPVKLVVFTQEYECPYCAQTRSLIEDLAGLSDEIGVEVYDFAADAEKARVYGIDKVPAVAIVGAEDYGLRFYGLPYGYEFGTLLDGIISVSRGTAEISEETREKLKGVKTFVHIQVFVTLTCPYCPSVASLAFKFAVESEMVRADVVDVSEFPHIGHKYGVMGVPKTVLNEKVEFLGAVPEDVFLEHVLLSARRPEYVL